MLKLVKSSPLMMAAKSTMKNLVLHVAYTPTCLSRLNGFTSHSLALKEDAAALQQIRSITKRTVVPVQSANVCHMSGGVRCMSWQVRGKNAECS